MIPHPYARSGYQGVRQILAPPYRHLPAEEIESLLESAGINPAFAEDIWSDIGNTLAKAAPTVLPVLGAAVGTAVGGPAGTAIGGALGNMAGQAVGAATAPRPAGAPKARPQHRNRPRAAAAPRQTAPRQTPAAASVPARATIGPARAVLPGGATAGTPGAYPAGTPGAYPAGAPGAYAPTGAPAATAVGYAPTGSATGAVPPDPYAPAATNAPASAQLLDLLSRPELTAALLAMTLGSAGAPEIPVGETPVPLGAFTNLLGQLTEQAAAEYHSQVGAQFHGPSPYLEGLDEAEAALPEVRAGRLLSLFAEADAQRDIYSEEDPAEAMAAYYDELELTDLYEEYEF